MNITVIIIYLFILISAVWGTFKFAIPALEKWMNWRAQLRNVKTISKHKGFMEIEYVLVPPDSPDEEFPLTIEAAKKFIENSRPLARAGLGEIHFIQRPSGYSHSIYGSFTPNGGEKSAHGSKICLYALKKDENGYRMYTDGDFYFYASEREAEEHLLFTLGHELAHNLFYNKDRNMFEGDIEQLCDHFAVQMGAADHFDQWRRSRTIYRDGIELGSYENLKYQESASGI